MGLESIVVETEIFEPNESFNQEQKIFETALVVPPLVTREVKSLQRTVHVFIQAHSLQYTFAMDSVKHGILKRELRQCWPLTQCRAWLHDLFDEHGDHFF